MHTIPYHGGAANDAPLISGDFAVTNLKTTQQPAEVGGTCKYTMYMDNHHN